MPVIVVASCALHLAYPHRRIYIYTSQVYNLFSDFLWRRLWIACCHGWEEVHMWRDGLMLLEQETLSVRDQQCPASTRQRPWTMAEPQRRL